jgi:heme oxygenase
MRSPSPDDRPPPEPTGNAPRQGRARRTLRAETAVPHETIERYFAPEAVTRGTYIRYLMMNQPFACIEEGLEAARIHRLLPDWDVRRRRFDLASDMRAMGIPPCAARTIPISDDIGTLLGWSYVLEGSRLGARFILRQIEATRSEELIGATRFLRHGGGMALWPTFMGTLSRIDDDLSAIDRACEAARAAFNCFLGAAENFRPPVLRSDGRVAMSLDAPRQ